MHGTKHDNKSPSVPKHSLFVVGNVGYRSFALEWRSLVLGAPVINESSYSFYDVVAQFNTLSEQLKTTTNAAERQVVTICGESRKFRIRLTV